MSKGSYKNQCKFTSAQNLPTGFAIKTFILQYLFTKTLNGKIFKLYLIVSVFQFAPCICHKSSHFHGTWSKMIKIFTLRGNRIMGEVFQKFVLKEQLKAVIKKLAIAGVNIGSSYRLHYTKKLPQNGWQIRLAYTGWHEYLYEI